MDIFKIIEEKNLIQKGEKTKNVSDEKVIIINSIKNAIENNKRVRINKVPHVY